MDQPTVDRRGFLGAMGAGALGAALAGGFPAARLLAAQAKPAKKWQPISDRKVRVGIVTHQSALRDGEMLKIPQYLPPPS